MRPQRGEMVGCLRTRAFHFENGSRLRARAALSPLWGPILAILAEGVLRGAKRVLVFERQRVYPKTALVFEREGVCALDFRPLGQSGRWRP